MFEDVPKPLSAPLVAVLRVSLALLLLVRPVVGSPPPLPSPVLFSAPVDVPAEVASVPPLLDVDGKFWPPVPDGGGVVRVARKVGVILISTLF